MLVYLGFAAVLAAVSLPREGQLQRLIKHLTCFVPSQPLFFPFSYKLISDDPGENPMQKLRWRGGMAAVIAASILVTGCATVRTVGKMQPGAGGEAGRMMSAWVKSDGDIAVATTWSRKARPGVTVAEIEEAFASVAAEDNIRPVGELPISKELELRSGKPERFLKVYSYCDPAAARQMVDFSPNMAAFLPCRISVVEQADGLWIYTMNMDMLIKMGRQLPPDVNLTLHRVRSTLFKMLERGAAGEF